MAEEPARPRRRGRTALLIAGAAVLGVVAGTCTGYLIQADREPTRLPSLSQPALAQAKGKGPEPLSAAQDRQVKADGDLRKLLIEKPGGTKKRDWLSDDGWMDLAEYAKTYTRPATMFNSLIHDELRRGCALGRTSQGGPGPGRVSWGPALCMYSTSAQQGARRGDLLRNPAGPGLRRRPRLRRADREEAVPGPALTHV